VPVPVGGNGEHHGRWADGRADRLTHPPRLMYVLRDGVLGWKPVLTLD
jgi:hypothetical protein